MLSPTRGLLQSCGGIWGKGDGERKSWMAGQRATAGQRVMRVLKETDTRMLLWS